MHRTHHMAARRSGRDGRAVALVHRQRCRAAHDTLVATCGRTRTFTRSGRHAVSGRQVGSRSGCHRWQPADELRLAPVSTTEPDRGGRRVRSTTLGRGAPPHGRRRPAARRGVCALEPSYSRPTRALRPSQIDERRAVPTADTDLELADGVGRPQSANRRIKRTSAGLPGTMPASHGSRAARRRGAPDRPWTARCPPDRTEHTRWRGQPPVEHIVDQDLEGLVGRLSAADSNRARAGVVHGIGPTAVRSWRVDRRATQDAGPACEHSRTVVG